MARRYRGRVAAGRRRRPPKKGQRGSGVLDTLKKNSKSYISKTTLEKARTYAPKLGPSEVKNKTARNFLNSAAAEQLVAT